MNTGAGMLLVRCHRYHVSSVVPRLYVRCFISVRGGMEFRIFIRYTVANVTQLYIFHLIFHFIFTFSLRKYKQFIENISHLQTTICVHILY